MYCTCAPRKSFLLQWFNCVSEPASNWHTAEIDTQPSSNHYYNNTILNNTRGRKRKLCSDYNLIKNISLPSFLSSLENNYHGISIVHKIIANSAIFGINGRWAPPCLFVTLGLFNERVITSCTSFNFNYLNTLDRIFYWYKYYICCFPRE